MKSVVAVCRTFKTKTIVFFDTKLLAHRLNIVLGLAGIKSAELHGNLAMTQRLEALDRQVVGSERGGGERGGQSVLVMPHGLCFFTTLHSCSVPAIVPRTPTARR